MFQFAHHRYFLKMPQNVSLYANQKKQEYFFLRACIGSGNQFSQGIKTNTVANVLYLTLTIVGFYHCEHFFEINITILNIL